LLDLQARIDVVDGQGESPVHIAVRNCQGGNDTIGKMMVSVLLQRYTGPKRQLVDMQSVAGDTATHIAVRAGNEAVLRTIVKHKPNLDLPNSAGETPRSLAQAQPPIIMELLVTGGAAGGAPAAGAAAAAAAPAPSAAPGGAAGGAGGAAAPPKNRKPVAMAAPGPAPPGAGLGTVGRGRQLPNVPGPGQAPGPGGRAIAASSGGEMARSYDKAEFNNVQSRQLEMPTANLTTRGASVGGERASEVGGVQESLQNLQAHIKRLFDTEGFEEEFEYLEKLTAAQIQNEDFSTALQPHNKDKNRYTNILPFERTRVVLGPVEGLVGSDYINASYMSGEVPGSQNAYIAAQGPKEVTVFDFWRMVYELKLSCIVMLGNNIEDGKIKFWQYWPEDFGAIDIGYFRVTYVSQESFFGEVYLRRYILTNTYTNEQSEICHLKYTAFPDHGVPDNTNGFLKLISLAEEESVRLGEKRGVGRKAVVVHCSGERKRGTRRSRSHVFFFFFFFFSWRRSNGHVHRSGDHDRQAQLRVDGDDPRPTAAQAQL
jgi:protein tyrosine phosphatase